MATFEKRILALETAGKGQVRPSALFITFVAAFNGLPAYSVPPIGWYFDGPCQRVNIMRLLGETDEILQERATAACQAKCHPRNAKYGVLLLPIESEVHADT